MRPELATINGMPPATDLPRGECIVTRLPDGSLRVDQADPRILISAELLDGIINGDWPPRAQVTLSMSDCGGRPIHGERYVGAVLKVDAVNQQVIYRIVDYVARVHGYIAEWPD